MASIDPVCLGPTNRSGCPGCVYDSGGLIQSQKQSGVELIGLDGARQVRLKQRSTGLVHDSQGVQGARNSGSVDVERGREKILLMDGWSRNLVSSYYYYGHALGSRRRLFAALPQPQTHTHNRQHERRGDTIRDVT
jgi:hypothetical protein